MHPDLVEPDNYWTKAAHAIFRSEMPLLLVLKDLERRLKAELGLGEDCPRTLPIAVHWKSCL